MFRKLLLTLTLVFALALPGAALAQETPINDAPLVDWLVGLWSDIATEVDIVTVDHPVAEEAVTPLLSEEVIAAHATLPQAETPLTNMLANLDADDRALFLNGLNTVARYALPVLNEIDLSALALEMDATDLTAE